MKTFEICQRCGETFFAGDTVKTARGPVCVKCEAVERGEYAPAF